ncbi:MAG: hypothetical protein MJZ93_07300 [Paludibacteraceae bacterium]|nr:hypothetical protein [Paludibacteraceae bacterium]
MKKLIRFIVAVAIVIATVATLLVSCRKENENTYGSNTRKPLAVFNSNSNLMTTQIDIATFEQKLNSIIAAKDDDTRYVVESIEVIDSVPSDSDIQSEIKLSILDTQTESGITFWLMDYFTEKVVSEQKTEYYMDEDVINGTYDYAYYENGTVFIVHVNKNGSYEVEEADSLLYNEFKPKWAIGCRTQSCVPTCNKIKIEDYHWSCTVCTSGTCQEVNSQFIEFLLAIIKITGDLI